MNREGFKTNGPVFIPFLGAALFAPKDMDRRQEAVIGIGGPILGSLFSFLLLGLYFVVKVKWLLMMAYMGIFLNLFNMIPITPLDGGRVTQVVGKWFKFVGFVLLLALTISMKQPGMLLIWIIVLFDFEFISIKARFGLAVMTLIAMTAMLVLHLGIRTEADFYVTCFDCLLGLFYLTLIGFALRRNSQELEETLNEGSKRVSISTSGKIKWFAVWLITSAILCAAIIALGPMLKLAVIS
ncbi:MAG: Zn-dependent protease [Patescibacteria group bacterium]|nr:Zn-dependent protease [Patescibacteria group bacterium]